MLPHQILGVSARATVPEITAAYKRLVKLLHPDHNSSADAAKQFQEVREAYKEMQVQNVATRVLVTLEDVERGGNVVGKTIDKCRSCSGAGGTEKYTCTMCFGQKVIWSGNLQKKCSKCGGQGYFFTNPCKECQGRGVIIADYPLTIPKGVKSGDKVGETKIEVAKHSRFIRKGLDLYVVVDLQLVDALEGNPVVVDLLNGKSIKCKISRLEDSDYTKRIAGYGLQDGNKKGTLHIRFRIVIPKHLQEVTVKEIARLLNA